MHMLLDCVIIIVAVFVAGAVITQVGAFMIARAHPPRGGFVAAGGAPQHLLDFGEASDAAAPSIVVLHGASANLNDMRLALSSHFISGRRVIFIDRPGQGYSARRADGGATPADQAAVLREIFDQLGI